MTQHTGAVDRSVTHARMCRPPAARQPRRARLAATAALAALLLVTLVAAPVPAQADPGPGGRVQVTDVVHDPAGTVTVSLVSADPAFDPAHLAAFVDALPVGVRVTEVHHRPPAAILLAIDTSGSMQGSALLAAQDAARRLLDRLPVDDRVALVSFAGWPLVLSDFTTDRAVTRAGLDVIAAVGETALYDTVDLATNLLAAQPADGPRVLVLLSDGRDSGWGSAERAGLTIDGVDRSAIEVHAFGLGEDVDTEYLSRLASVSGGAYHAIADEASLGTLFDALGTQLGDRYVVELPVPPLSTGAHTVSLRTGAGDPGFEAAFDVSNDGLFEARLAAPTADEPDAPLVIDIGGLAPNALTFSAQLEGTQLPVVDGRVYIDPWLVGSGDRTVEVTALIGSVAASTERVPVTVPPLEPIVTTTLSAGRHLEVEARVQGAAAPLIEVRDASAPDAPPLARATGPRLSIDLPADVGPLMIEVSGAGDVVVRRELAAPSAFADAGASGGFPLALPVAVAGLLAAAAVFVGVTRVRDRRQHTAIRVRARRFGTGETLTPPPPSELGCVVVRAPDGEERNFAVGPRPLTIGRASTCDIVLADPSVRPVHSRISGRDRGEFQVHGLRPGAYADRSAIDDWTVLHSGESIMVGEHVLTVFERVAEAGVAS